MTWRALKAQVELGGVSYFLTKKSLSFFSETSMTAVGH